MTLAPARTFAVAGTGDAAPAPIVFGAVADSAVSVTLRWRGPAPVTLASLSGPTGEALEGDAPRTHGTTSVQSGFRTAALGDHTATIVVPAGTQSWKATVKVLPPKPSKGVERDLRTTGVPPRAGVTLLNAGATVVAIVAGEQGGPNDLILRPTGLHVSGLVPDPRTGACGALGFEPAEAPLAYQFRCVAGWYAEIGDVVRSDGLVTSFRASVVRSPSGGGTVAFDSVAYDALGRPVSWNETRNFDATGDVHVLEVRDVVRRGDGVIVSYTLAHEVRSGPGAPSREVVSYAPVRTR
jgi:hypothetical protein